MQEWSELFGGVNAAGLVERERDCPRKVDRVAREWLRPIGAYICVVFS
jgi:hypothetical protein